MRLFNTALLKPRNIVVIGALAIVAHIAAIPLNRAVGAKSKDTE